MTLDLDAIRARDAAFHGAELDPFTPLTGGDSAQMPAYDRRDLLAEVDRLRAENAKLERQSDAHFDGWRAAYAAFIASLPVIEAARRMHRESTGPDPVPGCEFCDALAAWDASAPDRRGSEEEK